MTGIHGFSIEDAQALQKQLGKFLINLEEGWNEVILKWEALGECWRDRQYMKFEDKFEELSNQYRQTKQECESYYIFLEKKINEMKEIPTMADYIGVGVKFVSAFGSLMDATPLPSQLPSQPNLPISPSTSYVQTVPPKEDPLCSENKFDPEKEPSVQAFKSRPQFMRPMELKNQLDETAEPNEDEKRDRLRREMDISAVDSNQPKATGST